MIKLSYDSVPDRFIFRFIWMICFKTSQFKTKIVFKN
nr:MAG TPA: hypothetical protein [Caudoviricetes sp.]